MPNQAIKLALYGHLALINSRRRALGDRAIKVPQDSGRRSSCCAQEGKHMKIIYRAYTDLDAPALVRLMAQLGYEHSETTLASNVRAVRQQGGEVFVAEVAGNVLGCVSAIIDVRLAEGVKGEIVSLVVSEEARGHGIGKGLVLEAQQWLAGKVTVLRVRVNALREQSHLFYESLGYRKDKTQVVLTKRIEH